jgi:hypothetical protein
MCDNLNLAVALLADLNGVAEVSGAAIDLDAVVEKLLEGGEIEDLIVDRLGGVDHELFSFSKSAFRSTKDDFHTKKK